MNYTQRIFVPKHRLDQIEKWLSQQTEVRNGKDELDYFTTTFDNGYFADLNVCDSESGPYLDLVLFRPDGIECGIGDPEYHLFGPHYFEWEDNEYTVEIYTE